MTETMRVAVYYNNRDVRIEERPVPTIGPRELLVKVHASGICGSDVLEWYRVPKAPVVLGHEIVAEVVHVGDGVRDWNVGDRVFVSHHVPCGECAHCKAGHETVCETLRTTNFDPGGFAEYIRVPEINVRHGVFPIPDRVSWEEGVFIEPLACAIRGQRAAAVRAGQSVFVIGSGVAGLIHVRLARANDAAKVFATDLHESRIRTAKASGAASAWHASEDIPAHMRRENRGRLAEVVIVTTGSPAAIDQSFRSVEAGGTILFFAPTEPRSSIPMPFYDLWRNEVTLTSTYGAAPRDIRGSIEMLREGRIEVGDLVTHRLPLEQAAKGFSLVAEGKDSIKVMLIFGGRDERPDAGAR